jgi:prepilin-type N-terminal cleavage/methylation domain-containing protein
MKCCSEKNLAIALSRRRAFSLAEVMVALVILAFICSSVFVVINRCMASAADLTLRMQAFEVARDNMEKLLVSASVSEMSDYGTSDKYPEIQWQTTIETFYESLASRIWLQGVCSADYTDTAGNTQTIKLTHWLTEISKEQLLEIIKEKQTEKERSAEGYGAELGTGDQDESGQNKGEQDKTGQDQTKEEQSKQDQDKKDKAGQDKTGGDTQKDKKGTEEKSRPKEGVKKYCGYTFDELNRMPFDQVWQIIKNCGEF